MEELFKVLGAAAAVIGIGSSIGAPIICVYVLKNDLKWLSQALGEVKAAVFGPTGLNERLNTHEVRIVKLEEFRDEHDRKG